MAGGTDRPAREEDRAGLELAVEIVNRVHGRDPYSYNPQRAAAFGDVVEEIEGEIRKLDRRKEGKR